MEEIYKSSLLLIHSVAQLNGVCNQFSQSPTDDNGDKIVDIVDKCEEKFLKVKEEIVKMVKQVEDSKPQPVRSEVPPVGDEVNYNAIKTAGGYLINDKELI